MREVGHNTDARMCHRSHAMGGLSSASVITSRRVACEAMGCRRHGDGIWRSSSAPPRLGFCYASSRPQLRDSATTVSAGCGSASEGDRVEDSTVSLKVPWIVPTPYLCHHLSCASAKLEGVPPCVAVSRKIALGVCCMRRKMESRTMVSMLQRFDRLGFRPICFEEQMILHSPVEEWPLVDVMICFYSSGYPLDKVVAYAEHHPNTYFLTNPASQRILLDRRDIYTALQRNNIPVLPHVICSRDGYRGEPPATLVEHVDEDFIVVNGTRLCKPFVEKPADADDHNIYIYFNKARGGGGKRLFRKQMDTSSLFDANLTRVRTDGSFIYEEWVDTSVDIKCYTVGAHYVYAEQRKAPTVDGIVLRDGMGKELRQTVALTVRERIAACKVVNVFRQLVCGFDIIRRGENQFFVIDVNGWSFVKNSPDYVTTATRLMADIFTEKVQCRGLHRDVGNAELSRTLCGVVGAIRPAERMPKLKVKLYLRRGAFLGMAMTDVPSERDELVFRALDPKHKSV